MRLPALYLRQIAFYLIIPFLGFITSLRYYDRKWFKDILWLFVIFYGFSFSFADTMDANHYKYLFERAPKKYEGLSSITQVFDPTLTGQLDFAQPLLNFVLSSLTTNYHVLFAIYGLIFGYFYSRNISFLIDYCNLNGKKIKVWLLFAAFLVGAWQINGFRFWTATHIFLYGLLATLISGNRKKGILFMCLSLAFHFSFLLPLLVFWGFRFIPKFPKPYLLVLLALLFYNPFSNLAGVRNFAQQYAFNKVLERKVETYTSEEVADKIQNRESRYGMLKKVASKINNVLIILLAWRVRRFIEIPKFKRFREVYNYGLILSLTGALLSFIPSVGRFQMVGLLCLLFMGVVVYSYYPLVSVKKRLAFNTVCYLAIFNIFLANNWVFFTFSLHTLFGNYVTVMLDSKEVLYSIGLFIGEYI